jgi:bacillithiol synthase
VQIGPFSSYKAFGSVAGKFLHEPSRYADLIAFLPDWEGLLEAVKSREKRTNHNELLHLVLTEQLQSYFTDYPLVKENVDAFKLPSTLCITTGHQLVLAGGPAYLYYKIATVIALAKQVTTLTGTKVVPVFWMASEDHDIDELRDGNIKNKAYRWEGNWDGYSGVLPTDLLQDWKTKTIQELSQAGAPLTITNRIENAYRPGISLAQATTNFIMDVFGKSGLLILNPDEHRLKSLFSRVLEEELINQTSSKSIQATIDKWPEIWGMPKLEPQVKPREINLFYLHQNKRSRIIKDNQENYSAGENNLGNRGDLLNILSTAPEKFSPNVILRPLYQETILPNIAYIGGPGEMHYWLELKPVFDAFDVFYPVLLPRMSYFALAEKQMQKWNSLGLVEEDFAEKIEVIQKKQVDRLGENSIHWDAIKIELISKYEHLKSEVGNIDATLQAVVSAEMSKSILGLENIRAKINKSLKLKNETVLRQSEKILSELFPEGIPQERIETGIGLEWQIGPDFINQICAREIIPGDASTYLISY